jgi:hypothetical protein
MAARKQLLSSILKLIVIGIQMVFRVLWLPGCQIKDPTLVQALAK